MIAPVLPVKIPKGPSIAAVDIPLRDAMDAIRRALESSREAQVLEAISAAETYLNEAKKILRPKGTTR